MKCRLRPMTDAEFDIFCARSASGYADSIKNSEQITRDRAREIARKKIAALLPGGIRTAGHHLFQILLGEKLIGHLWYADPTSDRPAAFLYDVEVYGAYQGHGFGRQALALFESAARAGGATRVALHVFGENVRARDLYESSGYFVTNVHLAKDL